MSHIVRVDLRPLGFIKPHKVVEFNMHDHAAIARYLAEEDVESERAVAAELGRYAQEADARRLRAYDDHPYTEGMTAALGDAGFSAVSQFYLIQVKLTPGAVATIVFAEQTFAIAPIAAADVLVCNPNATGVAAGMCSVRATAGNAVIGYVNPTAGGLTPGAGTYNILAFRG